MNLIALKILLNEGHYLVAVMTTDEAGEFVKNWQLDKLPKVVANNNPPVGYWAWAVKSSEIIAVHTATLEALQVVQNTTKDTSPGIKRY